MKRSGGLLAQTALVIVAPLFIVLAGIAVGSVQVHNHTMRDAMAHSDLRTTGALAWALSEQAKASGTVSEQDIHHFVEQFDVDHAAVIILADASGHATYHSDAAQSAQAAQQQAIAQALAGLSGIVFTPEGNIITYAPVKMDNGNWALVIQDLGMGASNPLLNATLITPLILVPAIALSLLVLWLVTHRVVLPLQKLDKQVTALGWGDFGAVSQPVGGSREIEELQKALVRMSAQVQASQQGMHGYIVAVTQAQEEERKRLARELHDDTVQSLVTLKQQSHRIRRSLSREVSPTCDLSQTETALARLQEMITTTMDDVRRFSHALRPVYLEEAGLVSALEILVRDARTQANTHIQFETSGDTHRLPTEIELALYRITQEALTNALKHAQAGHIQVWIAFEPDGVIVRIEDDGIGFTQPARASDLVAAGHFGLMGIQERAQLIGAKLHIHSDPGQGTQIKVHVPCSTFNV